MFLFKIVNKILWPPYPTLTGSVTFCNDFLPLILHLRVSLPSQIQSNLPNNSLYEHFQSGFHSPHNAKTALLRVVNDLLHSADSGSINSLILLDFTGLLILLITPYCSHIYGLSQASVKQLLSGSRHISQIDNISYLLANSHLTLLLSLWEFHKVPF